MNPILWRYENRTKNQLNEHEKENEKKKKVRRGDSLPIQLQSGEW